MEGGGLRGGGGVGGLGGAGGVGGGGVGARMEGLKSSGSSLTPPPAGVGGYPALYPASLMGFNGPLACCGFIFPTRRDSLECRDSLERPTSDLLECPIPETPGVPSPRDSLECPAPIASKN